MMIAYLTRRFILTSLVLAMIASVAAFAIGRQEIPARAWVAGQTVPCVSPDSEFCDAQTPTGHGAD